MLPSRYILDTQIVWPFPLFSVIEERKKVNKEKEGKLKLTTYVLSHNRTTTVALALAEGTTPTRS